MECELEVESLLTGRAPEHGLNLLDAVPNRVVVQAKVGRARSIAAVMLEENTECGAQRTGFFGVGRERSQLLGDKGTAVVGVGATQSGKLYTVEGCDGSGGVTREAGNAKGVAGLAVAATEAIETARRTPLPDEYGRVECGQFPLVMMGGHPAPRGTQVNAHDQRLRRRQCASQGARDRVKWYVIFVVVVA
jgi:hypothetical protein